MNRFRSVLATFFVSARCRRAISLALSLAVFAVPANALEAGPESMQRLFFLAGSWTCTVQAGAGNSLVQTVTYAFSPDGLWMTEASKDSNAGRDDWAIQLWGYDTSARKLVAYNFARNGVRTKSVYGWRGGAFVSRRDDNGATVSLKPLSDDSIQWLIQSADRSTLVREDCIRRTR